MTEPNLPTKSSWRGRLYGFAFVTDLSRWLGIRRSVWFRTTAVLLFLLSLLLRLPLAVNLLVGGGMVGAWLIYWLAQRAGYVAFEVLHTAVAPEPTTTLRQEEKVSVRATGLFSVMARERYLLQKKADYWHYPLGEHAIMVEEAPGRYLYQFISAKRISHVKAGYLYLGEQRFPGLEIKYHTDWAPELVNEGSSYYVGGGLPDENLPHRTIYLTFHSHADWQRVWQTFVQ